jgi:carbonic anhydrase
MRCLFLVLCATLLAGADAHPAHEPAPGVAPLDALLKLSAGNARFAYGARSRSARPGEDADRRAEVAKGQHPFAGVVTCADSRLAPELIFDQTVGDLFVIRNAGNLVEPVGLGSLEYAVDHLGVRLIVVLGHSACGAVTAVSGAAEPLPGHLSDIQREMPGLKAFADAQRASGATSAEVVAAAVERNALDQAAAVLGESPILARAIAEHTLVVVSAVYDLNSGLVTFHPVTNDAPGHTGDADHPAAPDAPVPPSGKAAAPMHH